jgi:hypothetical protein
MLPRILHSTSRLGAFLIVPLLGGCVVRYGGATGELDEATAAAAGAQYIDLAQQLDALVGQAQDVDQRDRLEAAWRMARALAANPNDRAAVAEYVGALVKIESRSVPTSVDAVETNGALDSFAPTGTTIQEETIETADPAPAKP